MELGRCVILNFFGREIKMSVNAAKSLLEDSSNEVAKSLFSRISTSINQNNGQAFIGDLYKCYSDADISDTEFEALAVLFNNGIKQLNSIDDRVLLQKDDIQKIFKKRIWKHTNLGEVLQFRNCFTDMLMLDFITLDEYIELSNEIDRYIQYTLSNGGIK